MEVKPVFQQRHSASRFPPLFIANHLIFTHIFNVCPDHTALWIFNFALLLIVITKLTVCGRRHIG